MQRRVLGLLGATVVLALGVGCGKEKAAPCAAGTTCASSKTNTNPAGSSSGGAKDNDASPNGGASSTSASSSSGATEPEWIAPEVATRSNACGGAVPATLAGAHYTTPSGRTFHVWAPSNYDPNTAYPISMTYHGWYASGTAFQNWFKMENAVGNAGITVYPDALNNMWDLGGDSDLVFFDEIMKQLGDTYCINPSRVLGFGFSFGGKFMNYLGCRRAGYVKAIAVGDGSDGGPGSRCGRLPVLFVHRTHDNDERIDWARGAKNAWVSRMGCSAEAEPGDLTFNCAVNSGCRNPGNVTFCEDTFFDPSWPADWNHTVRDNYRAYVWQWFAALN